MSKLILGFLGLILAALPQMAGAQDFHGGYKYVAKFLCGRHENEEQGTGVVLGHYNTIINVAAVKNKTAVAYRSTWLAEDYEDCEESNHIDQGVPGEYRQRYDIDSDEAVSIGCFDIKSSLGERCQGFVEGMVVIYSSRPLTVTDVITGQGVEPDEGDYPLSVLETLEIREIKTSEKITPQDFDEMLR